MDRKKIVAVYQGGERLETTEIIVPPIRSDVYEVRCCEEIQLKFQHSFFNGLTRVAKYNCFSDSPCAYHCHSVLCIPHKVSEEYHWDRVNYPDQKIFVRFDKRLELYIHKPFYCPHMDLIRLTDEFEESAALTIRVIEGGRCQDIRNPTALERREMGQWKCCPHTPEPCTSDDESE